MNANEDIAHQNLWDAAKAVLRRNGFVVNVYIMKEGKSQINNLALPLRYWKKKSKPNLNRTEVSKK